MIHILNADPSFLGNVTRQYSIFQGRPTGRTALFGGLKIHMLWWSMKGAAQKLKCGGLVV